MKQTELVVLGLYSACMIGSIGYLVLGGGSSQGSGAVNLLLVMAVLIPFVPPL